MNYFKRIWAIGDIHGSYLPIENFYQRNKNTYDFDESTDCIILLGDAGLNYYLNERDTKFKKKLSSYPFTYFVIRGNHEERPFTLLMQSDNKWHAQRFFSGYSMVEDDFTNIIYAADYPNVYKINGFKTLVIPGAYSVDKYYRLAQSWNWFKDEQLTGAEKDHGINLCKLNDWTFDLVLSHTCPIIYEPTDLFISGVDQSTVDKSMEQYLGHIESQLDYKLWLWGHYHKYRVYPHFEDKQCIMLSAGEEVLKVNKIMCDTTKYPKLY